MTPTWDIMLIVLVALIGLASFFFSAAKHLIFEREIHNLAVDAHKLRHSQIKRLMELRGLDGWDSAELVMDPNIEIAVEHAAKGQAVEGIELDEEQLKQAA